MIGRGAQVDDQLGAAAEGLHRHRPVRIPDVLADVHTDGHVAQPEDGIAAADVKIALFVKNAVIGKEHFVVDAGDRAVVQHGGRVEDVLPAVDKTDDRRDALGQGADLVQGAQIIANKTGVQQEIFGRIARDRHFRKGHQLHALRARLGQRRGDFFDVPGQVADRAIDLGQPDSQPMHCRRSSTLVEGGTKGSYHAAWAMSRQPL